MKRFQAPNCFKSSYLDVKNK
uniref:Uncharacterized protein n=1 Tax=Anguilla anguilla TaxID=7936 RepID=A0A0E9Q3X1_ANGAN